MTESAATYQWTSYLCCTLWFLCGTTSQNSLTAGVLVYESNMWWWHAHPICIWEFCSFHSQDHTPGLTVLVRNVRAGITLWKVVLSGVQCQDLVKVSSLYNIYHELYCSTSIGCFWCCGVWRLSSMAASIDDHKPCHHLVLSPYRFGGISKVNKSISLLSPKLYA